MKDTDIFSRLETLSVTLNESSDTINQIIKNVEAKLASLRLGVEAWTLDPLASYPMLFKDGEQMEEKEEEYLGYTKVNGTWRLAIRTLVDGLEIENYTELTKAPRATRIKALRQIGDLYLALERNAEKVLRDLEKVKTEAANFIPKSQR